MSYKFNWPVAAAISAALLVLASAEASAQNIDTTATANTCFGNFGIVNTATYGQTITIPVGVTQLSSFGFEMQTIPATLAFRGEVYAWDNALSRPTGPALYESGIKSTTGATLQLVTFTPGTPVPVTPGQKYVLFASSSRDQAGHSGGGCWEANFGGNVYTGGDAVYINNGTDVSQWTSTPWAVNPSIDFGFVANFTSAPAPVPTLSEWAMILFGTLLAGGAALYVQRRRMTV